MNAHAETSDQRESFRCPVADARREAVLKVGQATFPARSPVQVGLYAVGKIERSIYPGAYSDGTAIRFESFQLWGLHTGR